MNIKRLNLNLLLTLDVLLSERHVTRASQKLNMTQSATSNALNQCRNWLQDDLLVRGGKEMVLTPYAQSIRAELHHLIEQFQTLVEKQAVFDAAHSKRIFRLGMPDLVAFFLLPFLLKRLQEKAPDVELIIEHVNHVRSHDAFLRGDFELVVGAVLDRNVHINTEYCFSFGGVVIARDNHPLLKKRLTLKQYCNAKHLRIHYQSAYGETNIDRALKRLRKQRDVRASLPHVLPALLVLQQSDLIATIPDIVSAQLIKKLKLKVCPIPFDVPKFDISMAWHRQNNQEPALCWLRKEIQWCMNSRHCEHSEATQCDLG